MYMCIPLYRMDRSLSLCVCMCACEQVVRFLHAQESRGITLTGEMRRSKHFRNPYFFDKMVRHLGIQDSGSLVSDAYDRVIDAPAGDETDGQSGGLVFWTSRDGVQALEKAWRDSEAERVRVQQQQQGQLQRAVHFQRASVLPGVDASAPAPVQPPMKKRKKKRWDA